MKSAIMAKDPRRRGMKTGVFCSITQLSSTASDTHTISIFTHITQYAVFVDQIFSNCNNDKKEI